MARRARRATRAPRGAGCARSSASSERPRRRRSSSRSWGACSCTRRSSARPRAAGLALLRRRRGHPAHRPRVDDGIPAASSGGRRDPRRVGDAHRFRPWLLLVFPAIGALLAGILSTWLAPETRGGGSDAIIESFHNNRGIVRKRVPFVKAVVSILTLGTGGSGGREGPTMQMGGAIGSLVGQMLRVTDRERRILLVAGTAAGMAADLPDAPRRGAPGRRDPAPRRLRGRRAGAGGPRERRQLLDLHRVLRRAHALRARADLSVRPRAPAALRAARGARVHRRERLPVDDARRAARSRRRLRRPRVVQARDRGPRARRLRDAGDRAHRPAPRAARPGHGHPRRRLRRGAARDHRRRRGSRSAGAGPSCLRCSAR